MSRHQSSYVLPDLVICGVPKAATSSLFDWIAAHPDALGTRDKETYFFVDPGTHMFRADQHVSVGLDSYAALFPPQKPSTSRPVARLEATPSYIYSRTALEYIPDLPSIPKCLFVLREPASQIRSLFSYFQGNWDWIPSDLSFRDYIAALDAGNPSFKGNELAENALSYACYTDFLEPWRARLGAGRMKVLLFEDLVADPRTVAREVSNWLGLDGGYYDDFVFADENATYAPRSRLLQRANLVLRSRMPKGEVYDFLRKLYRGVNTKRPPPPDSTEQAVMADLRARFTEPNRRLARNFDLDLSAWGVS